jgi:formamidopyrimidine-DNA glycosylase
VPELPEVETIVRELNRTVVGRRIEGVRIFRDDALGDQPRAEFRRRLIGRTIAAVGRRGKFLVFRLEPPMHLVAHLRMTGKFVFIRAPARSARTPHHRVWFELDGGDLLAFQDLRCFGTLAALEQAEAWPGLAKLGPEPLSPRFSAGVLGAALAESRAPLKHWLMDQTRVAGLGNIYVAEILFAARLSPLLPADRVAPSQVARLHRAVRRVLRQAIGKNGTTISDFRRVDDRTGEFQRFLKVYGRAGEPCTACKTPIVAIRQQQRSTFYCPRCQS